MIRTLFAFLGAICVVTPAGGCGGGGGGSGDGGGGGGGVTPTSAEGLWTGTSSNGRTISGIVLDNGQYWFIYSLIGNDTVIAGAVQGSGTSNLGNFSSSNGKDFNFEGLGVNSVAVSGTYTQKQSFSGNLNYGSEVITFSASYDADYETVPSLATLAGTFTGTGYAGLSEFTTVTISASGAITGQSSSGCQFTGSATRRSKGNVFNVVVTFLGGACANGTNTLNGVGYFDTTSKQIISAALTSDRTNGFIFVGTKP